MDIRRVGDFELGWGESLVWDERARRLYFVDCATSTIHWLDEGSTDLRSLRTPSMPTGLVPADDGRLVAVLDDGLHLVDVDAGVTEILAPYPNALDGRCNDACADLDGNIITGKLNLGPGEGSVWWYSASDGWRLVDPDISNTNGPAVAALGGRMTLIVGDTATHYYAYPYEPASGSVGDRAVYGDVTDLDGHPDGSTVDADGGLWCALVGGSQVVRFATGGLERRVPLPLANPTDVTFGGPDLDLLYVVSIGGSGPLDGALLEIAATGCVGRAEPRFAVR